MTKAIMMKIPRIPMRTRQPPHPLSSPHNRDRNFREGGGGAETGEYADRLTWVAPKSLSGTRFGRRGDFFRLPRLLGVSSKDSSPNCELTRGWEVGVCSISSVSWISSAYQPPVFSGAPVG